MRKSFIAAVAALSLFAATNLSAQKMGYLNSLALLAEIPEVAQADTIIIQLRDSLVQDGQAKAKVLQDKYTTYMQEMNQGSLPPREAQKREAEIQQGQEELEQYEQQISGWLGQNREILFGPILDRLQKAIDEVGVEGGYQFIFDVSSMNLIVYAEQSEDVSNLVRAKLGLAKVEKDKE